MSDISTVISMQDRMSSTVRRIGENVSELNEQLNSTDRNINKVGSSAEKIKGALSSFGNAAIKGLKATVTAISAVSAAMGGLAAKGVQYNATMEYYKTSFEVMTGSAAKAVETVERLKKLGAATPFEMTDLANATQLLMNYGFTAEKAVERLQMLGDISQGDKDKLARIATPYGQMSSAGKVSLEDVKQMIEAGFNPLQEINEKTGESMASLYDRISHGKLAVSEIEDSMKRATSAGGKYFKSMEKQSKTFNGLMSTMKDNAMQFLGGLTEGLHKDLSVSFLPNIISAIDELSSAFEGGGISGVLNVLPKVLKNVMNDVGAYLAKGLPMLVTIATSTLIALAPALVETFVNIFPTVMNSVFDLLNSIADYLRGNADMLADSAANMIIQLFEGLYNSMHSSTSAFIKIVLALGKGIAKVLPKAIPLLIGAVIRFINYLTGNMGNIIDVGWQIMLGLIQGIMNALPIIIQAAPVIIENLLNSFTGNFDKIFEYGAILLNSLLGGIVENLPNLVTAAIKIISTLWNYLVQYSPLMFRAALTLLAGFAQTIIDNLPNIIEAGIGIIAALIAGIFQMGNAAYAAGENAGDTIKGGIGSIDWEDVGDKIVRGIIKGMSKGIQSGAKQFGQVFVDWGWMSQTDFDKGLETMQNSPLGYLYKDDYFKPKIRAIDPGLPEWAKEKIAGAKNNNVDISSADVAKPFQNLDLTNSGAEIMTSLKSGMEFKMPDIKSAAELGGSDITSIFENVDLNNIGSNTVSGLGNGMNAEMPNVKTSSTTFTGEIENIFDSVNLTSAGENMMLGLRAGMMNKLSFLRSTASLMANSISNAFNAAMQIHSPSKVMAWSGEMIGLGLIGGMKKTADDIANVSDGLGAEIRLNSGEVLGSGTMKSGENIVNINVDMSGMQNEVRGDMSIDSIVAKLTERIEEELAVTGRGVFA